MRYAPYTAIFYDAEHSVIAARAINDDMGSAVSAVVRLCDQTSDVAWGELWTGAHKVLTYQSPRSAHPLHYRALH